MKKLIITGAILSIVIGGAAGLMLANNTNRSEQAKSVAPAAKEPNTESTNDTDTPEEVATVPQQTVTPKSQVAAPSQATQNRAKLQAAVTTISNTILQGIGKPASLSEAFIAIQWGCVDKLVGANPGYENYDAILANSAFLALTPTQNEDGSVIYHYFDSIGTCRVINVQVP